MKSLLDIQQEIRELEKNMSSLTNDLKSIQSDIENMRNTSPDTGIDYSKIEVLAKQIPFKNHPLGQLQNDSTSQSYLEMLLNLVRLDADRDATINRMAFVQWIQMKSKTNWTLEELYKDSFNITKESYYNFSEAITGKYRDYFMVDAMIVANVSGKANPEIMNYLAELSAILGINKERLQTLSLVAQVVLRQSADDIRDELKVIKSSTNMFFYYNLNDRMIEAALTVQRKFVKIMESIFYENEWKVRDKQMVQEGKIIAIYETYDVHGDKNKHKVVAPCSGQIHIFRANSKEFGFFGINDSVFGKDFAVIANKLDDREAIIKWLKELESRSR